LGKGTLRGAHLSENVALRKGIPLPGNGRQPFMALPTSKKGETNGPDNQSTPNQGHLLASIPRAGKKRTRLAQDVGTKKEDGPTSKKKRGPDYVSLRPEGGGIALSRQKKGLVGGKQKETHDTRKINNNNLHYY